MRQEGFLEREGFTLRYCSEGCGPDTLIIGSALYYPRLFSQNLRRSLRCHFIDYRGFAPGPNSELTWESLIEDVEAFRKYLGCGRSIVIGHSVHALLALEYAKKYPSHVSHLVLILPRANNSSHVLSRILRVTPSDKVLDDLRLFLPHSQVTIQVFYHLCLVLDPFLPRCVFTS